MLSASWFADSCKDITRDNKKIWVAYSGGVDSHVLLYLATLCWPQVYAIHVNHGLSPNATAWQLHCQDVCTQLNVKLKCISVDAKPKPKQSPEDAARIARRNAWQQTLSAKDLLLVAHHAEDQAETILYRLFRGTGPKGMSGIKQRTKIGELSIFRPLLSVEKNDILDFAQSHNLQYISDESNLDCKYSRNYIRHQIMPLLKHRWPAVMANINRAGLLTAQLQQCIDPIIAEKLQSVCMDDSDELHLDKLQEFDEVWQLEIIRAWFQAHNLSPSYTQILLLKQQVIAASIDANPIYVISDKTIRRSNSKLYMLSNEHILKSAEAINFESMWDLTRNLQLPDGKSLNLNQVSTDALFISKLRQQQVTVRLGVHGHKAKKIFQQFAIPAWERGQYPLIFANGRLVAIAGLWTSGRF